MEQLTPVERNSVISELSKISARGIKHPDEVDIHDPVAAEALNLYLVYAKQQLAVAKGIGTLSAQLECSLDLSTVQADAGFTDPDYIEEIANDVLVQDEQAAVDNGLEELAVKIKNKADELNTRLS